MSTDPNPSKRGPGRPKATPTALAEPAAGSYGDATLSLANDLANFIKENKLSTQMQGKEYVNVEGWQYAGSRLGIVPIVETVTDRSAGEELKYEARVSLFDLGRGYTVGAGFAICSNKESGKKFYQEFAIASMAQTRAIGKAYRNILAWIIRAAGYEATPAEEMEYGGNTPTVATAAAPAPAAAPAATPAPAAQPTAPRPAAPNGATGAAARITPPSADELPWLTDPATPTPQLKAPVLLPVAEPAPAAPVMVASTTPARSTPPPRPGTAAAAVAGRTAALQGAGVLMSTGLQHNLIGLLLQSPAVSNSQRTATLLNYLRFTHDRAQTSIGRLVKAIQMAQAELPENFLRMKAAIEAEYEQLQVPGSRAAVEAELRFFANTSGEQLGKVEQARLLSICVNPAYSAEQLREELEHGRAYLIDLATNAA